MHDPSAREHARARPKSGNAHDQALRAAPPPLKVGIFWDSEGVHPPSSARRFCEPSQVGARLRDAAHAVTGGEVATFRLYYDRSKKQHGVYEDAFTRDGIIELVDCPPMGVKLKETADKMLLVDMLAFACEHLVSGRRVTVVLCANDGDYAHACTTLRRLGVHVVIWHSGAGGQGNTVSSHALLRAAHECQSFRSVLERRADDEPVVEPAAPSITVADAAASVGAGAGKAELPCPFLNIGKCSMGKRCKFRHDGDADGWRAIPCALGEKGPHGRVCAAKGACIYHHQDATGKSATGGQGSSADSARATNASRADAGSHSAAGSALVAAGMPGALLDTGSPPAAGSGSPQSVVTSAVAGLTERSSAPGRARAQNHIC